MTELKEYLETQIKDADYRLGQLKESADDLQDRLAIMIQQATEQASRKSTLIATLEEMQRQEQALIQPV